MTSSNAEVVKSSDIVWVATKPHAVASVLREVSPVVRREQLFVSVAAGTTLRSLSKVYMSIYTQCTFVQVDVYVQVCVCVCVCVCVHVCVHVIACVYVHACLHTCVCLSMRACMCVCCMNCAPFISNMCFTNQSP